MSESKPLALSVKVVLIDDNSRCLLLKRSSKCKGNSGKWDFPGGKIDEGESFDQALLREVREETGLIISITKPAGVAQSESPAKRIFYLMLEGRLESGEVTLSDEHDDYVWTPLIHLSTLELPEQFLEFARAYSQRVSRSKS